MDESSSRTSAVLPFTQPAERRQAWYYKTVLAERRAQVQDELASQCLKLVQLQGSNAKGATRQLTHTIGEKRHEENQKEQPRFQTLQYPMNQRRIPGEDGHTGTTYRSTPTYRFH